MTKSEKNARFTALAAMGCIVCRVQHGFYVPACIHHLIGIKWRGMGKKATDEHTLPLCHAHHQGALGIHTIGMRPWERLFGTQELLLETVNSTLRNTH